MLAFVEIILFLHLLLQLRTLLQILLFVHETHIPAHIQTVDDLLDFFGAAGVASDSAIIYRAKFRN